MGGYRLQRGIQLITALMLLAWPFLIWFGLTYNGLRWLVPLMVFLLILRVRQVRQTIGPMRLVIQSVVSAGVALCILSYLLQAHQLLLFYPVMVNLVMLVLFGSSLWSSMPLVERLARLQAPELPPEGVRYTRKVTQIWCVFFILNGAMALFTVLYGEMWLWTTWNGMIAYVLMGILMMGEWLVRRQVIKRAAP
ncbi:membrane protein [Serratia sp. DD3]|uniref:COG4648 family protein n=1 Tax=Serratia sp. DD3 TaxID=1410619 RepID=UPI0003C4F7FD|nr:membrane protein [Serratia sp. DD3]KEY58556.1 putative membrane protein [Serratia sp. DD3]